MSANCPDCSLWLHREAIDFATKLVPTMEFEVIAYLNQIRMTF